MPTPQFFFADLVREACRAGGTGALALDGALPGNRRFADVVPVGAVFAYAVAGVARPEQWETGTGRIDSAGHLERISVTASSNGGARVDFAPLLKSVALTVGAGWFQAASLPPSVADVAGLNEALAGKQAAGNYAAVTHGHVIADVTGLQGALDGKQPVSTGFADAAAMADGDKITVRTASGWANVAASTLLRRNASGKVGLGTNSPAQTLSVVGDLGLAAPFDANVSFTSSNQTGPVRSGLFQLDSAGNMVFRNTTAGSLYFDSFSGDVFFRVAGAGYAARLTISAASLRPGSDNAMTLGTASLRFATVFAASGVIATSDRAMKKHIGGVPVGWLDVWADVRWRRFRFRKGTRWHVGLIAQEVGDAFAAHGIDGCAIGLLCRDMTDGGERWGLRYDECFALEAAWQRRELARLDARLAALECQAGVGA